MQKKHAEIGNNHYLVKVYIMANAENKPQEKKRKED